MDEDPINNFFTSKEVDDPKLLYTVLGLTDKSTGEEVRKAYRKKALLLHPDKHTSKDVKEKEELGKEFQRVGFAYAVLSDEAKRKRYDASGRTDDKFADAEEMGWDAYFGQLFERLDGKMLDAHKEKYQGSSEEIEDLMEAYKKHNGSLPKLIEEIPHSQHQDESRFIQIINDLISKSELTQTPLWKRTSTDEKARAKREKAASRAAKEAEAHAKELGVWDEFYGNGNKGKRKSDAQDKDQEAGGGVGGGEDALAALIMRRQKDREGGLDRLAEKYARIEEEERAKKKGKKVKGKKGDTDEVDTGAQKELSDADFEALQAKMFGGKDKAKKTKTK